MADRPDVVLVRHGETAWSRTHRHTGRTDVPLTDVGRDQAARAGRALAGREFALVMTSPLGRALDTCRAAGLAEQAEVSDDLVEWDYGDAEGLSTAQLQERTPGWTVWTHPVGGTGESAAEVGERADRVVARVEQAGGDVALFAHGHVLRILTARWLGHARRGRPALRPRDGHDQRAVVGARQPGRRDLERRLPPALSRDPAGLGGQSPSRRQGWQNVDRPT